MKTNNSNVYISNVIAFDVFTNDNYDHFQGVVVVSHTYQNINKNCVDISMPWKLEMKVNRSGTLI